MLTGLDDDQQFGLLGSTRMDEGPYFAGCSVR